MAETIAREVELSYGNDILPAVKWAKEKSESDADKDNADKTGTQYTQIGRASDGVEWSYVVDITYPNRDLASRDKYDQEILFTVIKTGNLTAIREAEAAAETAEEKRQAQIIEKEKEIYANLRDMLIETREYQILFNNLIPIKNMIASLSLYEFCALSDTAVYPEVSEAGINLADMLTKTKLSILQIFCASIYGNKKITYTDPFLEKAGTDLVS